MIDPLSAHTGGPIANIEYKIRNVPEMGYSINDRDDNGNSI